MDPSLVDTRMVTSGDLDAQASCWDELDCVVRNVYQIQYFQKFKFEVQNLNFRCY